ncbi:MAG TPA: TldD/PmbA family protein [Desulfurobacteriaceae bacterium]|nr:TldD/PmbA family protein [Desulfurobacteriaceae bacterium]
MNIKNLIDKLSNYLASKVESFDIFMERSFSKSLSTKDLKLEKYQVKESLNLGIRVVKNNKLGFATTNIIDEKNIFEVADTAIELSKFSDPDDYPFAKKEEHKEFNIKLFYPQRDISFEEMLSFALDIENKLRKDKRIIGIRKSGVSVSEGEVYYLNHLNNFYHLKFSTSSSSVLAIGQGKKDRQYTWGADVKRSFSFLEPQKIVKEAQENLNYLLDAEEIETQTINIVFSEEMVEELITSLGVAFLGKNILRGKSLFKDSLGEKIASEKLSLLDSPIEKEGLSSTPYDGEGVKTFKKFVIEKGVLKNFILDLYTANKLNMKTTGNCSRGAASLPAPHFSNLIVLPSKATQEDLFEGKVLYVISAMGLHTIDPISGDFSIGVEGALFENGKHIKNVRGVTLAGNVKDLLNNISLIGNNLKWMGSFAAPKIRVDGLKVAGL